MKVFQNCFKTLLIICLLFNIAKLEDSEPETFDIEAPTNYEFDCKGPYCHVVVMGASNETNYVVSLYYDEERTKRIQLAQSLNGHAILVDKIDEPRKLYITIECDYFATCEGVWKYGSDDMLDIDEGVSFGFYVQEDKKKWEFLIKKSNIENIVNVWVNGHKEITTYLVGVNQEGYKEKDNKFIIHEKVENATLIVNANPGDFINVGVIGLEQDEKAQGNFFNSKNPIEVNGPTITGYLHKDYIEQICYPLQLKDEKYEKKQKLIFGTGMVLTKIAHTYISPDYAHKEEDTELGNDNGLKNGKLANIFNTQDLKGHNLCVTFPKDESNRYQDLEEIIFTYQLVMASTMNNGINIYQPQIKGLFYRRMTIQNSVAVFLPHTFDTSLDHLGGKINLNIMTRKGFPEMYVFTCKNYPICDTNYLKGETRIRNINRISTYSFTNENTYDPIGKVQTIMAVKCQKSEKLSPDGAETKYFDKYCVYESLIYDNDDPIEILEDDYFNQYALQNEVHDYKINLGKEKMIEKVFIDIMPFVGAVTVEIITADLNPSQYFAINKNYIIINLKETGFDKDEIIFRVKALKNTYYSVLVNLGRDDTIEKESSITNQLQTGMSYLATIDTTILDKYSTTNKIIKIRNERTYDSLNVMVNFKTINCLIDVYHTDNMKESASSIDESLKVKDNFGFLTQDIVLSTDSAYKEEELDYRIKVTKNDYSQYVGKLCKIYVSSVEITEKHDENTRDILIPDDSPQQIMFGEHLNHTSFGYVHANFKNSLLINFRPLHQAKYRVSIYIEGEETQGDEIIVVSNKLIELNGTYFEARCLDESRVCYVQIDITWDEETCKNFPKPVLEVSVKSVETTPVSYLTKNFLTNDHLQNDQPQYYYTELGNKETGFVVVNFLRGSGSVYGRIVQGELKFPEEGADWQKYVLPNEKSDHIMDEFTKQFEFDTFEFDCRTGCFLLLKVVSDVEIEKNSDNLRNYPYSILVHSYATDLPLTEIPVMTIPLDQYIIGSVAVEQPVNRIYKFYSVLMNADGDKVVFDFQSETATIYINVGTQLPSPEQSHFQFSPKGKNSIYSISEEDLIAKDGGKKTCMKDIVLTIGVWTDMTDSLFTSPYALAVRIEGDKPYNIYRVNSDQRASCKATKIPESEDYRCLYVIENQYLSKYTSLMLYATPQDLDASISIYAKYLEPENYELGHLDANMIPNVNNMQFFSKRAFNDYLYIKEGLDNTQYLIVSVEATKETIIDFYSNINLLQNGITANPSTPQLFSTLTNFHYTINFPKDYMVMANIVGIFGKAEISWEGDDYKYFLKGRDDRLSITSTKKGMNHKLVIKTEEQVEDEYGFIFLLSYHIRNENSNVDPLNLYKSVNYAYVDNDLPIIYYSPISTLQMENTDYYEIFFTFNLLEDKETKDRTYYESIPFDVNGHILKENYIYELKAYPSIQVSSKRKMTGVYDPAIRTGLIRVNKDEIEQIEIPKNQRPFLYLRIDKTEEFKNVRHYKKIGVETTVLRSNSDIPVSEKTYQFGLIQPGETKRYTLKTNTQFKYMSLQFSCLDNRLSVKIEGSKKSLSAGQFKYGKTFYSLPMSPNEEDKVYFIIENKQNTDEYFTFRYSFSMEDNESNKYISSQSNIKVEKNLTNNEYLIEVYPFKTSAKADHKNPDFTYIVRLIDDVRPKNADISMKVKNQIVKEFYNPKEIGTKVILNVYNVTKRFQYIQVIAQLKEEDDIQYLSYDLSEDFGGGSSSTTPEKPKSESKTAMIVVIVVGSVLFVVVIVLIVVIVVFNNKNKDLLDKVNKVSFADTQDRQGDDNDLLAPIN